jgi:hypothetical protein
VLAHTSGGPGGAVSVPSPGPAAAGQAGRRFHVGCQCYRTVALLTTFCYVVLIFTLSFYVYNQCQETAV